MATVRLFQGTEDFFEITCTNDDGTPIQFDGSTVTFFAYDWNRTLIFRKAGSLSPPNPDVVLDNANGIVQAWIRAVDTASVSDMTCWQYYVEIEPGDGSGPYALDVGDIVIRPRPSTPNQMPPFLSGFPDDDFDDDDF